MKIDIKRDTVSESEEVIFSTLDSLGVDDQAIVDLIVRSKETERQRFRLCAHGEPSAPQHEMFIVHPHNAYIPPHKHLNKTESLLVIEGTTDYFTFDEQGNITKQITLKKPGSGESFYYRVADSVYHSMLIQSEVLVFLEISTGPFCRHDTIVAPWAPEVNDKESIEVYFKKLLSWIEKVND